MVTIFIATRNNTGKRGHSTPSEAPKQPPGMTPRYPFGLRAHLGGGWGGRLEPGAPCAEARGASYASVSALVHSSA